MERKVVVVCRVVGFLGLLSAAIGFVAEAIRIVDSQAQSVSRIHCAYPQNPISSLLGLTAVVALLISQIVLNVSAGCICCRKSPRFPDSNWGVAMISFILSWFTFIIAVLNFVTAVLFGYTCYAGRAGAFAGGAVLALANSAFGIVYYLTLTAAGSDGGDSSSYPPNQEGIAMGQPQIPRNSQDPVFVHEDTYNRRQFP